MEDLAPLPRSARSLGKSTGSAFSRLRGAAQWRAIALTQPRFLVGVCALLRAPDGRVLLLEHRFWQGVRWGCPSGYMTPGETPEQTAARECREECGVRARDLEVVRLIAGFRRRVEVWCTGSIDIDAAPARADLQRREITGAALLPPADALTRMRPSQARVVRELLAA